MVKVDAVGLYPSITHETSLNSFKEAADNIENKHIPTDNLSEMAEFVLKKNYFEFNVKVKKTVVSYSHCIDVFQYFFG